MKVTVIYVTKFLKTFPIKILFYSQLSNDKNELNNSKKDHCSSKYYTNTFSLWNITRLYIEHIIKMLDIHIYWLNNTIKIL